MKRLQVETVYDSKAPWSESGAELKKARDVPAILKAAKIDWSVEKRPLFDGNGNKSSGFGIFRATDDACLGIVGSKYKPVQNADAFELFADFLKDGGTRMDIAGSLSGGRLVWGMARLGDDFRLPGGDALTPYLFLGVPHGLNRSLTLRVVTVRDVCNNTLSIAMRDKHARVTWKMKHSSILDLPKKEAARELIMGALEDAREHQVVAKKLMKIKVSDDKAANIVTKIFGSKVDVETDRASLRVRQILDAYRNAPGAMPGNAWGLLNGVTYWTDHINGRKPDKRMESAMLGHNASRKNNFVSKLLELA